jgi:hypothetical protein
MKNVKNWRIMEFVKDENGQFSSTRLFAFSIIGSALYEWYSAIWQSTGIWHPNATTVGLVMGVLGMKVMKKDQESKAGHNQDKKS